MESGKRIVYGRDGSAQAEGANLFACRIVQFHAIDSRLRVGVRKRIGAVPVDALDSSVAPFDEKVALELQINGVKEHDGFG